MHELPGDTQTKSGRLLRVLQLWNGSLPADPAWRRQGRLLLKMLKHTFSKCLGFIDVLNASK